MAPLVKDAGLLLRPPPADVFPFRKLPAELRNWVYSYLTPIDNRLSESQGLFLSCKQMYREAEAAVTAEMGKHIDNITEDWDERADAKLHVTKPTTFAEMRCLKPSFPLSYFFDRDSADVGADFLLDNTMIAFVSFNVDCFEISFYNDSTRLTAISETNFNLDEVLELSSGFNSMIRALIFHLGECTMKFPSAPRPRHGYMHPNKVIMDFTAFPAAIFNLTICVSILTIEMNQFERQERGATLYKWRLELQDREGGEIRTSCRDLFKATAAFFVRIAPTAVPLRCIWTKTKDPMNDPYHVAGYAISFNANDGRVQTLGINSAKARNVPTKMREPRKRRHSV